MIFIWNCIYWLSPSSNFDRWNYRVSPLSLPEVITANNEHRLLNQILMNGSDRFDLWTQTTFMTQCGGYDKICCCFLIFLRKKSQQHICSKKFRNLLELFVKRFPNIVLLIYQPFLLYFPQARNYCVFFCDVRPVCSHMK